MHFLEVVIWAINVYFLRVIYCFETCDEMN